MSIKDMFLELDPPVRGEVTEPDHADAMAITGWSWGMTSSRSPSSGRRALSTALSELKVVRYADRASTGLMSVMRKNQRFDAELSVRKAGHPAYDYFVVKARDCRITSYDVGAEDGSLLLVERLTIAFEKIEVTTRAQDERGGRLGETVFEADAGAAT